MKFEDLKKLAPQLKLPPPSMVELKLENLELLPGKSMTSRLPFQERFTNPVGVFQGGFLVAGIDDVMGPLSYVTAQGPCMTLAMNTTFLKPFTREMSSCLIRVEVLKDSKNFIFMRAEVRSQEGDLLAHAESHVQKVKT